MNAFHERRVQDLNKLRELAATSNGKVIISRVEGNPVRRIAVELGYKTAGSVAYPSTKQDTSRIQIDLSARYPFQKPAATILTPIFHPNVFPNGRICLGAKWLPSDGLDLLLKRIVQIITFDQSILNETSPANLQALDWYRRRVREFPDAFPTDRVDLSGAAPKQRPVWKDIGGPPVGEKMVVSCPHCGQRMRLPGSKRGIVECVRCKRTFEAQT